MESHDHIPLDGSAEADSRAIEGISRRSVVVLISIIVFSLVFVWTPYFPILLSLVVFSIRAARRVPGEGRKRAWTALAGTFAGLLLLEVICFVAGARVYWAPLFEADTELGYVALFDSLERRREQGGMRQTPASDRSSGCHVVFLGGSFTFGGSLDEAETLPQHFAEQAGEPVAVHNFGLGGWGGHQALRLIEAGIVEDVIGAAPDHVVYTAVPHHAYRATGRMPWDLAGPEYTLQPDGEVEYQGPHRSQRVAWWLYQAQRSYVSSFVLGRTVLSDALRDGDYERYLGIVRSMRRIVEERYGATFRVVIWSGGTDLRAAVPVDVAEEGSTVYLEEEIIPGFLDDPSQYQLPDWHPTGAANAAVAEYLVRALKAENDGRICNASPAAPARGR